MSHQLWMLGYGVSSKGEYIENSIISVARGDGSWGDGRVMIGAGWPPGGAMFTVSGDASITGELRVDNNTFVVDAAGNMVGVGSKAPKSTLHVDFTRAGEHISAGISISNINGATNDFAPIYFGNHGGGRRKKAGIGLKR